MVLEFKDQILFQGIRAGNEDTFKVLFEEYYVRLAIFAQKYVNELDLAREIVQDFFVHLYEYRESITIQTSIKSYFYQSIRNRCLNIIKQQNIRLYHHEIMRAEMTDSEKEWQDKMMETELANQIHCIVMSLPKKCRQVFQLSRQEGLSNKVISEKMHLSVRTVETHISHALKVLRESLKDYF